MSGQPLDYATILADLEAKRAAIDATIAAIRAAMGIGAVNITDVTGVATSAPGATQTSFPAITGADIPDGAFFRKSVPDATAHLLAMLKKKQTAQEVADALLRGGMESNSGDFLSVVIAGLNRARKTPNSPIVKLPGNYWGLKEWYPKGIISANLSEHTKKRRKKKARKTANSPVTHQPNTTPEESLEKRIEAFAWENMGGIVNFKQVVEAFPGMKPAVASMNLGRIAKKCGWNKTTDGGYHIQGKIQEMPKAG